MNQEYVTMLAQELNISPEQVKATVRLLDDAATIPFIARYRKEVTGALDESVILALRDRVAQLRSLDKRRESILKSAREQGKLTDELQAKIVQAKTLSALEDLYLPFRPKRRTRAGIAREKGLEPLAHLLFSEQANLDPLIEAAGYVDPQKDIKSPEDALAGARDVIAEWINEDPQVRERLRELFMRKGIIRSRVIPGKEAQGVQYLDYYDWEESVGEAPSHRILAVRRGEKEEFLAVRIAPPEGEALAILERLIVKGDSPASLQVKTAAHDSYRRLLAPSLESETGHWAKKRADREAIRIFADNLRHLLMAPPLGPKRVMAIDPGFRTGCKTVCLDAQGKLVHSETIYPHSGERAASSAAEHILALCRDFQVEAVAIGNGTAGRETETFVRGVKLPESIAVVMVDESGASVYSASRVAREEFPDHDVTVRGSVSIGRRLMDPLAELVKIDPRSIGVGQYQHDVDEAELKRCLDDQVMSCVNAVGVEVNTASPQLLAYVSGLGPQLAKKIVEYRNENGPFRSRTMLRKVPRLGPKAFEQAAGFLRIRDGENPLDASAVHPESYPVVQAMARDLGVSLTDLIGNSRIRQEIDPTLYVTTTMGLPTLNDILAELARPGRDPRATFEPFSFAAGIEKIEDLERGMKLPGIVTNVTAFGAFVDIGVHRDGLVHLSELADRFVRDPGEVVRVHQQVIVTVLEVDRERKRISLSMKKSSIPSKARNESDERPVSAQIRKTSTHEKKKTVFNNPFARQLKNFDTPGKKGS